MRNFIFIPIVLLTLCSCDPMQRTINIPDVKFKSYLIEHFDNDRDSEISKAEAILVDKIEINTDKIYSLEGIEHFINLEYLVCNEVV